MWAKAYDACAEEEGHDELASPFCRIGEHEWAFGSVLSWSVEWPATVRKSLEHESRLDAVHIGSHAMHVLGSLSLL